MDGVLVHLSQERLSVGLILATSSENLIETQGLTKIFKSKVKSEGPRASIFKRGESRIVRAVDHLTLEIKRGELFGLLGPNGAGKTTLVKILCTLLPPDGGTAHVNGFDIATEPMDVKRSIGTLFSVGERGFFWRLTGYRNLEFFSAIHNVPRRGRHKRIMEVLELVGLKDNAFELYQKYSGGMKRKLALARTLLPDPPILLLDEPTTGLDVMSSRNIREFIRNDLSKKADKTVLYTTHFVEEASQICDRIGIMNRGRLVACDTPEAIKNTVKKNEVVDMTVDNIEADQIGALKTMKGVISIEGEVEGSTLERRRLRIQLETIDALPMVFDFLFNGKIKLISFKREEPTLEEAFVQLTKTGPE
jgi:ABC-2 type transport system ATP-binding protein